MLMELCQLINNNGINSDKPFCYTAQHLPLPGKSNSFLRLPLRNFQKALGGDLHSTRCYMSTLCRLWKIRVANGATNNN